MISHSLVLSLLCFISISASVVRIPLGYDVGRNPYVNVTIQQTLEEIVISAPLSLTARNQLGYPQIESSGDVYFRTIDSSSPPSFPLVDPHMNFCGHQRFESRLAIGRDSFLLNQVESISIMKDTSQVVFNLSRDEFVNSCYNASMILIQTTGVFSPVFFGYLRVDNIESLRRSAQFELCELPLNVLIAFHSELVTEIEDRLFASGVSDSPHRNLLNNCSHENLASLPIVYLRTPDAGGELALFPEDYIQVITDGSRTCRIRYILATDHHCFNPLLLEGVNLRLSNSLVEICDSI